MTTNIILYLTFLTKTLFFNVPIKRLYYEIVINSILETLKSKLPINLNT